MHMQNEIREEYGLEKLTAPSMRRLQQDVDDDEEMRETVWEDRAGACDDRFVHMVGRISAVRDASCNILSS